MDMPVIHIKASTSIFNIIKAKKTIIHQLFFHSAVCLLTNPCPLCPPRPSWFRGARSSFLFPLSFPTYCQHISLHLKIVLAIFSDFLQNPSLFLKGIILFISISFLFRYHINQLGSSHYLHAYTSKAIHRKLIYYV